MRSRCRAESPPDASPPKDGRSAGVMLENSVAAGTIIRAWYDRLRGRLRPMPCPVALAGLLEVPGRRLVAGAARILGVFGVNAGERVLEIGPGVGFYSLALAQRVGTDGQLICLDVQMDMLRETRRRLAAAELRRQCVQASALTLPFASASMDRVVLITVLGELPDRGRALAEIRRVLRPGGSLSVSEQFPDPDFVTRGTLRRELRAAGFVEERMSGWLVHASIWRVAG